MTTTDEELARGWRVHQAGDKVAAERIYRDTLARDPNSANGWCYLGIALHDQERFDESVAAYRQALRLQPQFPVALNNLGNTFRSQRRLKEALTCFDEAIRLKPDYVNAHKNKGTALLWEGFIPEALACYSQALALAPEDAESHKNVGVIRLLQGNFAEGWREYEWRQKAVARLLPDVDLPRWAGESLAGRTILLVSEQGLGDTIQFVRYAELLKQQYNCRVALATLKPLLPLLARYPAIDELSVMGEAIPRADFWLPLLSLPLALGHESVESFPTQASYLTAPEDLIEQWRKVLSAYPGFKIGVAWAGSASYQADRYRSFPLKQLLAPFARLAGVRFFSLQKGPGVEQLQTTAGLADVVDFGDRLDASGPFLDTAALMKNLDLVITADSAAGHLAGALGVPYWLALSKVPDWRWMLDRDDSPWYPSVRLFRQNTMGDWNDVFQRMADALIAETSVAETNPVRLKRPAEYRVATTGHNRLALTRHGLLLYNRHDRYIGRSIEQYGEFSEWECELFRQLLRPGAVVIEAGANIGSHTVPLAKIVGPAGRVYAFEPQRIVFQTLCANVALNSLDQVDCRCEALGTTPGSIVVPRLDYDQENNFGGLGLGQYQTGEQVPVTTIDGLNLERLDFLKADVEGMELDVLRGASATIERHKPLLYLENDRQDRSPALLGHLLGIGYRLYWHLPPMYSPQNYYANAENVFGGIVSVNVFGVHESHKANVVGLKPIMAAHEFWRE